MEPIHEQHLSEPGLVVFDMTAADEVTVEAVMASLDRLWATSGPGARAPDGRGSGGEGAVVRGHPPRSCRLRLFVTGGRSAGPGTPGRPSGSGTQRGAFSRPDYGCFPVRRRAGGWRVRTMGYW
ncbi:DUF6207 family protein [Streptomyces sp. NPDC058770]|uniref:DUF6207 family protein n=1 Tax=Streptomyces sp. NPDC058770 TaxID=3346631 RepID=UPI0036AFBFA8